MAREYQRSETFDLMPDDDVWAMFARAERVLRQKFEPIMDLRTPLGGRIGYDLADAGGAFDAMTLAEARAEAEGSRHTLRSVTFGVSRLGILEVTPIYVSVHASNLDREQITEKVHLKATVSVTAHLANEDEAIGVVRTVVDEMLHVRTQKELSAAPSPVITVIEPAPELEPLALPARPVSPVPRAPEKKDPWYNHPWTVTVVGGIVVVIVGVILTAIIFGG